MLTNLCSRSVFVCSGVINLEEGRQPEVVTKVPAGDEVMVYRYDLSCTHTSLVLLFAQVQEFSRSDT